MAMQAGIGASRILILVGAGYTGTFLFKNGKLSDILGELQNLVKGNEKQGDESNGDSDYADAIAQQVRRLAMEVKQLASTRQITVLNGNSAGNLTSLVVPAAALGALGYGYMWWKGLSFSDLMYVTKRNMTNAVSNMTKHLEHVSEALAATKRHLTQRIENVDGKLDEQVELSKSINNKVNDARSDLSQIGYDLDTLQSMVSGLDGKMMSLEDKQDLANAGVFVLLNLAEGRKVKMPKFLQEQVEHYGKCGGYLPSSQSQSLKGLKDIAGSLPSFDTHRSITDGIVQDSIDKLDDRPRTLMRTASIKC
ncbi:unnamed protein product [Ilex paraguariensis]|uniref:DUF1664 domain-containing protein n=1 Tax=Ilex paraguariensis TaxID=185542 RepID=A0ABC8V1U0_9AQUA